MSTPAVSGSLVGCVTVCKYLYTRDLVICRGIPHHDFVDGKLS